MRIENPPAGLPCQPRAPMPDPRWRIPALNAPVRSLKMLELQHKAGATEIYLSLRPAAGIGQSFCSLPGDRDGQPTQVPTSSLLAEIVAAAHRAGMTVWFSADTPVLSPRYRAAYREHVELGLDAGCDGVIVGSLAAVRLLADRGAPLIAGQPLSVSTLGYARHLHDHYGISRIIAPHTLALDEIALLNRLPGIDVEVPVQTGSGLDCARCRLADQPGIGLGCRAGYDGVDGDLGGFLDGAADCALCDVGALMELGVAALTIPGRESPNLKQNAKITQLYRRVLDGQAEKVPMPELIERIDRVELMWQMGWVPRLCDQHRCRFRDTPQGRAYV